MKTFVALSCLLAVATASWIPQLAVLQAQHLPIIGPNGVPLEPPANVAARAQHAAAVAEAQARNGDISLIAPGLIGLSGLISPWAQTVIGPNGVPLEPAANVAARAQHAAAVAEARARNGDLSGLAIVGGISGISGIHGIPLANGVPVEPLANQIARAQHAAAVINAQVHGRKRRSIVALANGVPVEPLANQIARAQHAQAVALAQSGLILTPGALGLGLIPASATVPAIGVDGQPIKTPEVQILEAKHAQAHAEARARNLADGILIPSWAGIPAIANGVPLDTPEVAAARAAHLAAKAAALHGAWA